MELRALTYKQEVPAPLAQTPDASENYACWAYDFHSDVGIFAHLGRWSLDRKRWREQFYVFLPGNRLVVHRGVGGGDTAQGPRAAHQQQSCLEPGKRWRWQFSGPAVPYTSAELVAGQPAENPAVRLEVDLEFDGHLPAFFYPSVDNTTWGTWHYEQHGRIHGTVRFEDHEYHIDGLAFRDHTRGPRNLTRFAGSNWIHGELPGGRGFALFQVYSAESDPPTLTLDEFTLVGPDSIETAKVLTAPDLRCLDDLDAPIQIIAETSSGLIDIEARPRNIMVFSVYGRHEILIGVARGKASLVVAERPLELVVNGQPAFGYAECCRLLTNTSPQLRSLSNPVG
jgi:hypothetical protein